MKNANSVVFALLLSVPLCMQAMEPSNLSRIQKNHDASGDVSYILRNKVTHDFTQNIPLTKEDVATILDGYVLQNVAEHGKYVRACNAVAAERKKNAKKLFGLSCLSALALGGTVAAQTYAGSHAVVRDPKFVQAQYVLAGSVASTALLAVTQCMQANKSFFSELYNCFFGKVEKEATPQQSSIVSPASSSEDLDMLCRSSFGGAERSCEDHQSPGADTACHSPLASHIVALRPSSVDAATSIDHASQSRSTSPIAWSKNDAATATDSVALHDAATEMNDLENVVTESTHEDDSQTWRSVDEQPAGKEQAVSNSDVDSMYS